MLHQIAESTSSADSVCLDESSTRRSSFDTPPSTLHSSASSIKNSSSSLSDLPKRSSLKSDLNASRSGTSLAVRFDVSEMPKVPQIQVHASCTPESNAPQQSFLGTTLAKPASVRNQSKLLLRKKLTQRYSSATPVSQNVNKRSSAPPIPYNPRVSSAPGSAMGSRAASFQSIASAPAVLESLTPTPSQPPSQYNPLEHYLPCMFEGCTKHYTPSLLGPTFYSPQQPYQMTRKRALCLWHAHEDLKLANARVKSEWESMRQNAGRKILGLIAADFEVFVQQCREDRAWESDELEAQQRKRILRNTPTGTKGKEREGEGWDWTYTPRPCTKKGCSTQWYSPFDNRLYLFYHTNRPSGLRPLITLCPSCARADVEGTEEKIQQRKGDVGGGPEWVQWCEQIKNDRVMEEEYWLKAQERVVWEKGVVASTATLERIRSKEAPVEKRRKNQKLKGICIVM